MRPLLFAFPADHALARTIAASLPADTGALRWRHFPDGESLVTVDAECAGRDVAFVIGFREPDHFALPLLFAARTARELGARRVGLIAPYLPYMRQDKRFHPGEAVSSIHFAAFLAFCVDWLVTVDPHLHRHADLSALYPIPTRIVSAMPAIAAWIATHVARPVLIGPDSESRQWVERAAAAASAPFVVLEKQRRGDHDVSVSNPDRAVLDDRTPVLVDDIVSSGRTLIETLARLKQLETRPAVCVAVHGIFAEDSDAALLAAGAARVVSTDSLAHPTNAIGLGDDIAAAVRQLLEAGG